MSLPDLLPVAKRRPFVISTTAVKKNPTIKTNIKN
jgi:hypothetical protein